MGTKAAARSEIPQPYATDATTLCPSQPQQNQAGTAAANTTAPNNSARAAVLPLTTHSQQ
jgi:hypothetical protein